MADVYPEGVPPDVTPIDSLIGMLGDEAERRGEHLLDSAERRARVIVAETEMHALGVVAALFAAWLVLRK